MEEEEIADPLDINKDPIAIKEAQNDIGKLDVLVCGRCHDVFHYIEEFREHQDKCSEISTIRDNYKHEPKAQVWAFMLWKNAQIRKITENESNASPWAIYQKWSKLDTEQKDAWIKAAELIQNNTKIATARLQEVRTKPVFVEKKKLVKPGLVAVGSAQKKDEDDPLEEGEIRLKVPSGKTKSKERDPLEGADIRASESDLDTEEEVERELARIHGEAETPRSEKKTFKPVQLNSDVTILPSTRASKKALRTSTNKELKPEEYVVEKILSKRFNPRKRTFEYFIKWENFDSSQNTWEPASHLNSCKAMVEEFEENLRKQKAAKAAKAAAEKKALVDDLERTPGGRPQRTSKQKALKQVKSWCGDISEGDEGSGKRKSFSDDDSSDSFEKRMKMEEDTDTSEDERPMVTIRKVQKSPASLNGVAKKTEQTTIIPEKKIIRINEKQLPGLSSGVYVMSKTEGIIKLDSSSPGKGGTLMKIAPKIGQTRIKVVKKEDGTTSNIVKVTPNLLQKVNRNIVKPSPSTPVTKQTVQSKGVTVSTIKRGEGIKLNIIEKPKIEKKVESEEESDGLEELEFPTDLPLPEPDSPPGEFTLDPVTGKLLGQKTPTPPPEPEPEPEPEPSSQTSESLSASEPIVSDSPSLDNLVKLAAADLTEEDLKAEVPDDSNNVTSMENNQEVAQPSPIETDSAGALVDPVSLEGGALASTDSAASTDTSRVSELSSEPEKTTVTSITTDTAPLISTDSVVSAPAETTTTNKEAVSKVVKTQVYSIVPNSGVSSSTSSILSTALKNSNIKEGQTSTSTPKKLLSTPSTVRQKVGVQQHQQRTTPLISRVITPKPSPNATFIQKVSPGRPPSMGGRGRGFASRQATHTSQDPFLKRTPNVNTYRNTSSNKNVPRRIGHTTIYRTTVNQPAPIIPKAEETLVLNAADLGQEDSVEQVQAAGVSGGQSAVISMPLLTDDESNQSEIAAVESSAAAATAIEGTSTLAAVAGDDSIMDVSGFALAEGETPIFITGEDGTIYQVAGQNEDGQTILITQGPDGQQQCMLVATDGLTEEGQALPIGEVNDDESADVHEPLVVNTDTQAETADNGEESQVVAQIVKADPPSPGGTRKVVLMLPDGNLMMTDVTAEQYAALELDK